MKTIFFINNAKKGINEPNSIVLRFYLKLSKKYKVKGLGISCSKKDWNQEEQKVKRSNSSYKKFNSRLNFIEAELIKIEEKREVNEDDIEQIVKASIRGVEVSKIINEDENLRTLIINYIDYIKFKEKSNTTIYNYESFLSKFESFEKYNESIITLDDLNFNINQIQEKLLYWFRKVENNRDSSIQVYFGKLNTAIHHYNDVNNKNIPVFVHKKNEYKNDDKVNVYLTKEELSNLYKFVYNPSEEMMGIKRPKEKQMNYLKYFLLRCFVGMRISEMNNNNINNNRVDPFSKDLQSNNSLIERDLYYSYKAIKNSKTVKVPYIGNYLYDIASDLQWEFPDLSIRKDYILYNRDEPKMVGKILKQIYGKNIRKVEYNIDGKYIYKELSDCISTHTARKTFAFLIYNINKDLVQVMHCLGHSSIEITMNYMGINLDTKSIESFRLDL